MPEETIEQKPTKPKYEGVSIYMDGREWVIPTLSVRQFRQHYKLLLDTDVTVENWQDKVAERIPLILAAMSRNYPEVTEEQLLDMLDLRSFNAVLLAISNASGIRRAQPGESGPAATTK